MKVNIYNIAVSVTVMTWILFFGSLVFYQGVYINHNVFKEIKKRPNYFFEEALFNNKRIEITTTAKITAYPPDKKHTDSTPHITAFNTHVRDGIVAISKPLEQDYGLKHGDEIIIPDVGRFIVADRMNQSKWKDYRVDIFMWSSNECRKFGIMEKPITLVKNKGNYANVYK